MQIFYYEKLKNEITSENILNLKNLYGVTPLHYACYFGNRRAIDLLLDLGADINSKDDEGNTCLHFAINSGCIKTIKKLILRGVDKSIKRNIISQPMI